MSFDFHDKSVVVTGGASGIGLAVAAGMAKAGARVSIFDVNPEHLKEVSRLTGARCFEVDVVSRQSVEDAFALIEDPEIVIVNAGIGSQSDLLQTKAELWEKTLAVNLSGVFYTVQIAAQRMRRLGRGSIVLTASTNSYDGEADLVAYNASKAGVLGILHTAANELGPFGIRVNAVCPGLIRTPLTARHFANPQLLADYFRQIPLGRGGEPQEVAQAIMFLASDQASYITGAALLVDGGQMASKFGTWGGESDSFDGQRWIRKNI